MSPRKRLLLIFAGLIVLTIFIDQGRRSYREHSQDKNINAAARRYQVDASLVKAVIWRESRFDPSVRGRKGELGLMQIMPESTGRDWAAAQHLPGYTGAVLLDASRNVDCGAWYLRKLLARYQNTDNPMPYALADYNAGRANAIKWMTGPAATNSAAFIAQIGFPSTRTYVRAILRRRDRYVRQAGGSAMGERTYLRTSPQWNATFRSLLAIAVAISLREWETAPAGCPIGIWGQFP